MSSKCIPYYRVEDMRRINRRIKETPDPWERELYQITKKINAQLPYDTIDKIMEDAIKKLPEYPKKNTRKYVSIGFILITIMIFRVRCRYRKNSDTVIFR